MSFQITISASRRAAARFVVAARRAIQKAYVEEQKANGLTQTAIARTLGVHRSVVNWELRGLKDITLGRVAELSWAMGREPVFELRRSAAHGNHAHAAPQTAGVISERPLNPPPETASNNAIGRSDFEMAA